MSCVTSFLLEFLFIYKNFRLLFNYCYLIATSKIACIVKLIKIHSFPHLLALITQTKSIVLVGGTIRLAIDFPFYDILVGFVFFSITVLCSPSRASRPSFLEKFGVVA